MNDYKEVSRSVVIDDNVNITSLSLVDMVRLVVSTFTKDEAAELETAEKMSKEYLKKVGSLDSLFRRAINKMENLNENSVTLNIASSYLPYIDEIISDKTGWGRFYNIEYKKTNIPMSVNHKFLCVIRKK